MEAIFKGLILGIIGVIIFFAFYIPFGPPASCCQSPDAAQAVAAPANTTASGVIRVASDDSRMPQILTGVNGMMQEYGIQFTQVPRNASADIEVDFVQSVGPSHIGGGTTAGGDTRGNYVRLVNAPMSARLVRNALHEFVHAGGYVRHDSDPASLMCSPAGSQIRPEHIEALRSMAGGGILGGLSLWWLAVPVAAFLILKK